MTFIPRILASASFPRYGQIFASERGVRYFNAYIRLPISD